MLKHKITSIIMGALMLSGVVLAGAAINNTKITNDNTKVVNKVLLAAPSSLIGERAVVVNTDNSPLVLYSNASANSTITSYISVGEMLTIQSAGNNFYKVKVQETGAVGYISAHNLQIITSGVDDVYNAVNKQGYIINVSSRVNLRANATMSSNILAKLTNNTKLNVLGKQGQWYKVNCNGTIGYIYQEYIGLTNADLKNSDKSKSTNTSSHITIKTKTLANNKSDSSSSVSKITNKNNSSSTNNIVMNLGNIQNTVIKQMVQYFKNYDASQHIPTKDLGSSSLFYQTAQAIINQYVTKTSLKDTFDINGPSYSNIKINSYYSSKKVSGKINIPQREWSTTGNGYYVVSIQKYS
ncbi:SH3 domain-containing protein [Clostridium mediterraneense]|uniref:SH3 domain-containing protein n=1 Tax=Clostridium mediterraneense TaxID=1805472 RepID=UPI00082FCD8E|nr:SH3 domain-containing protein [Clostridium mediterraneense]